MRDDKKFQLDSLAELMELENRTGLAELRRQQGWSFVFGEGNPRAQVVFVGEAPGRREAETGEPFVGAAGKLLDSLLEEIGLKRESVYITNVVKDRPPGNRRPRMGEIKTYKRYLLHQLNIIQPEVIVPLGLVSTRVLLTEFVEPSSKIKMQDVHGRLFQGNAGWGQLSILPMYHPAATFYGSLSKVDLQQDFDVLHELLNGD